MDPAEGMTQNRYMDQGSRINHIMDYHTTGWWNDTKTEIRKTPVELTTQWIRIDSG